jgi:predicted ATPase
MGDVYRGTDLQTGQAVAIKALRPEVVTADPNALARFLREGEALRTLNHPNIVQMLDGIEQDGRHYLVMEYVPGGSLRDLLDRSSGLPIQHVVQIALDVADALTRAHRLGILHRDLKPSNVLLAEDGTPRLSDFGIAYTAHAGAGQSQPLTEAGVVVGTADYISPEAVNGETLDARADIWAFGVMLYEMLVGERPFRGEHPMATLMAILTQPIPDVQRAADSQARPDVPDTLADLVYRMLEKERGQRIPSVRLVGAELEGILQAIPHPSSAVRRPSSSPTGSRFATPTPTVEAPKHNLPTQPTPFVGRETELAELVRLLSDPGVRLVTVLGAGGMGKTRLALEAAQAQLGRYADGVYLVALAPLRSAESMVPTIARAIGFAFYSGGEPKEQLLNYLRQRNLLLVLDNFEHLVEGVGIVVEILRAAPRVKVLATSRSGLHVQGEHRFPVSGMSYSDSLSAEDALAYSAVRLFAEGARRAQPGFELTDGNVADVVRICRLVDGVPLALLLAATWVEMLTPAEIARELAPEIEGSLDLLEADLRDAPERQRSMRAVFEHSWELLLEGQQAVLRALSVFRGGFTREAAQAVVGASLRDLMSLVDRSLLYRTPEGQYEMHALLRQCATEKLDRSPAAAEAVRDRHCAYYVSALQRWEADLKGPRQQAAMAEMEADIDNARGAWEWAVEGVPERMQVERLSQAMDGLGLFYSHRLRRQEGESAFRLTAERLAGRLPPDVVRPLCARALTWQGSFCRSPGALERARGLLRQSLDLLDASAPADTRRERAHVLYTMGLWEMVSGNHEKAQQLYMQALALYRTLDRCWETAETLSEFARTTHMLGEFDRAKGLSQEAVAIRRALGDQWGLVNSLTLLGMTLRTLGQFGEAERVGQEGLAIAREMGDRALILEALYPVARVLMWKGEFAESRVLAEEGLKIGNDLDARYSFNYIFLTHSLGYTMAHLGRYEEARVHTQQALALAQDSDPIAIGLALLVLGLVALAEGNPAEARQYLQEGTAVMRERREQPSVGTLLAALAGAARGLGRLAQARELLCEAFQLYREIRNGLTPLIALPVAALLVADGGEAERAVELYALASRYPHVANSRLWEDIAGQHIAALAATLPPDVVAAAQERGRARDLWATVEELLIELEGWQAVDDG